MCVYAKDTPFFSLSLVGLFALNNGTPCIALPAPILKAGQRTRSRRRQASGCFLSYKLPLGREQRRQLPQRYFRRLGIVAVRHEAVAGVLEALLGYPHINQR
jgi:hypothetical protein